MGVSFNPLVHLLKPLGFKDLQQAADDSKGGTFWIAVRLPKSLPSSIFRRLILREAHERPEGMEEAAVMMVLEEVRRHAGASDLESQPRGDERSMRPVGDYSMQNVAGGSGAADP